MRIRRLRPSVSIMFIPLLSMLPPPAAPQAAPDQVLIQAGTHIVLVNVVAKDKRGKPVDNLTRDDFVLRDNGQEQKIALFALEESRDAAAAVASPPARLSSPTGRSRISRPSPCFCSMN